MKKLRIVLVATVSILLIAMAVMSASATKWTDVPDDAWYTSAVVKANELGIMNGTSATTFAPSRICPVQNTLLFSSVSQRERLILSSASPTFPQMLGTSSTLAGLRKQALSQATAMLRHSAVMHSSHVSSSCS